MLGNFLYINSLLFLTLKQLFRSVAALNRLCNILPNVLMVVPTKQKLKTEQGICQYSRYGGSKCIETAPVAQPHTPIKL
jgi:hypothetical protein